MRIESNALGRLGDRAPPARHRPPCARVPLATITVVHTSALVRAGLASMLGPSPEFDVRDWHGHAIATPRSPDAPVHIVLGDAPGVEQMLDQETLRCAHDEATAPRVLLLTASREAPPIHSIGSIVIDACLSVDCHPEELHVALRELCWRGHPRLPTPRTCAAPRGGLAPAALRRVREHIDSLLSQRIELNDLAALAGLSGCHFSRAFKQSVGVPPHRYVMQRRVEVAAALIEQTDRPLSEIALEVGFADQSHFTRMFSRLVRQTPRQYRFGRR